MKKYIIFMLAVITANIHSMETEKSTNITLKQFPVEVLDRIAQFLPFHDVETENEFIARTKALESLEGAEMPEEYLTQLTFDDLDFDDIKCHGYCPNNALVGVLHKCPNYEYTDMGSELYLSIINREKEKENPQLVHEMDKWCSRFRQMAISRDGNLIAAIHSEIDNSPRETEEMRYIEVLTITNLSTNTTEQHNIGDTTVLAFNKQGTDIIMHQPSYYPTPHRIIPITINSPATINNANTRIQPQKTLAKYFAQKGICKDLLGQLQEQKSNSRKTTASQHLLTINNQ